MKITKDTLIREYLNTDRNIKEVAKFLGVSVPVISYNLKKFNINTKKRKIDNLSGKKYGKWTVLEYVGNKKDTIYLCECECGFRKINTRGTLLSKNGTKQCKKCYNKSLSNKEECLTGTIFSKIVNSAKKRGIEINVSIEYCWGLFLLQNRRCNVSGLPIFFALTSQEHNHSGSTASLDRINSSKGYIEGNVQWVHKDINRMKWSFNEDYFKHVCLLISNFKPIVTNESKVEKIEFRNYKKINGGQKLTDDNIREIRELKKNGKTNIEISKKFNCTPANISLILNGISRRNVK